MITADVVIVGAGPAGSVVAQRLAAAGVRVVLLEKATFPRDKICGDAVTVEGLMALERSGLGEWVKQFKAITAMRFTAPDRQVLDMPVKAVNGGVIGRIIPRRLMDEQLARSAVKAGVDLKEGIRVESVDRQNGGVRVSSRGLEVEARMIILADGSHAPVTRHLGLIKEQRSDLTAVRQYLAGDSDPAGPIEFHFQQEILPGYTWLIPMGDGHMNIGCGTYTWRVTKKEIDLRQALEAFKARHPLSEARLAKTEPLGPIKGHPLHTRLDRTRTHAERVLVTGDAAGLVSPFTGEGIAAAMRSGERAAATSLKALSGGDFSEAALSPYTRSIEEWYKADQRAGRILRSVLKYPGLLNRVIRRLQKDKEMAELFTQIFLDEKSPRLLLRPAALIRIL